MWRVVRMIAPRRCADWIDAMLAESCVLDQSGRLRWQVAALGCAIRFRIAEPGSRAILLAAAMVAADWNWGHWFIALGLMGLAAMSLVCSGGTRLRLAVLVVAGTLPTAHAMANWVPVLRPHYQFAPLDERDWLVLALVAATGVALVAVAEGVSRATRRNRLPY